MQVHNHEHIVPANIEQFKQWQEASGNLIKLVTYAPEEEGALEFEQYLAETGVVGTMGHTDAIDAQLKTETLHMQRIYTIKCVDYITVNQELLVMCY